MFSESSHFNFEPVLYAASQYSDITPFYESSRGYSRLFVATKNGKRYILKTLKEHYAQNQTYTALLYKEFEIGYELNHPNIRQTIDYLSLPEFGEVIVLEYIDGQTLAKELEHEINAPKTIHEICEALTYIHKKQIVVADLKPENIIITANGANVKLIDFGFADRDSYEILKGVGGTNKYISPEQIRGEKLDCRSDIYALGVIIKDVFGNNPKGKYRKAVLKCTSVVPSQRYADCGKLLKDLEKSKRNHQWVIGLFVAILMMVVYALNIKKSSVDLVPVKNSDTIIARISYDQPVEKPSKVRPAKQESFNCPTQAEIDGVSDAEYQRRNIAMKNCLIVIGEESSALGRRLAQKLEDLSLDEDDRFIVQDSIETTQKTNAIVENYFPGVVNCSQKKLCLTFAVESVKVEVCSKRGDYSKAYHQKIISEYQRSTDSIAERLKRNNVVRKVQVNTGKFNRINYDSLQLQWDLEREKRETCAMIWYNLTKDLRKHP